MLLSSMIGVALVAGAGGTTVADAGPTTLPGVISAVFVGNGPAGVAVNERKGQVYVANASDDTISVIDASDYRTTTIAVGDQPSAVGVNNVTDRVYVGNYADSSVTVIDGITGQVVTTISLSGQPAGIAVNSRTNKVYVTNGTGASVAVIDGAVNRVVATVAVQGFPEGIAVNPATNRVYVVGGNALSIIYVDDNNGVKTFSNIGSTTTDVAVSTSLDRVFVTDTFGNAVHVFDGVTNRRIGVAAAGNYPIGITVSATSGRVYVANQGNDEQGLNHVTVIDASTLRVLGAVMVGGSVWPGDVAVDPNSRRAFVSLAGSGMVSVLGPNA